MSDVVIRAEKISKLFRIGHAEQESESLAGAIMKTISAPVRNFRNLYRLDAQKSYRDRVARNGDGTSNDDRGHVDSADLIWALRDVSFEVERGEVLGIIGHNGAGKSTLLKILSRITEPTDGRLMMKGRVSSLLEVGTGFHPELTGRDNVYLNGTILGMSRKEIDRKFDQIVEFSGVEKFLETPVKRYSSGMKVRLAFSVAAHLDPEVLIIDEVLAVGDMDFQRKCLGRLREVTRTDGRTVLFVSHNMGSIAELCDRCVMLERGVITSGGDPTSVISSYLQRNSSTTGEIDLRNWTSGREGSGPLRFTRVSMHLAGDRPSGIFAYGDPIRIRFSIEGPPGIPFGITLGIKSGNGQLVMNYSSLRDAADLQTEPGELTVELDAGENLFNEGDYYLYLSIYDHDLKLLDRVDDCLQFRVDSQSKGKVRSNGLIRPRGSWRSVVGSASV